MKYLYKYPQAAYPCDEIVEATRTRGRNDLEYELLDTGIFDVFVEYSKASPEDVLMRITVNNRVPDAATLHLLPAIWFRDVWSRRADGPRPALRHGDAGTLAMSHPVLGRLGAIFLRDGNGCRGPQRRAAIPDPLRHCGARAILPGRLRDRDRRHGFRSVETVT